MGRQAKLRQAEPSRAPVTQGVMTWDQLAVSLEQLVQDWRWAPAAPRPASKPRLPARRSLSDASTSDGRFGRLAAHSERLHMLPFILASGGSTGFLPGRRPRLSDRRVWQNPPPCLYSPHAMAVTRCCGSADLHTREQQTPNRLSLERPFLRLSVSP
ncbi:hypothetical protein AAFF_G00046790 [Aldrovandia affinis]|uniref:Uncharacterized protein n=1 Tax=Aldrovandia affinis TaxID=143900 RepID=A0AAD7WF35_9TELE|nr:hypothetical protein AAFF_G00046790 [Aldrovandia affinis]